jgi:hypothetical protein
MMMMMMKRRRRRRSATATRLAKVDSIHWWPQPRQPANFDPKTTSIVPPIETVV